MQRTASALVVVALALTACAGDQPDVGLERLRPAAAPAGSPTGDSTPVTEADAPPSAATTAGIGVTTAPDEVTPEWVTAVVNALLAEYGEMTAEILAMPVQDDPTLPDGFEERLDALFDGEYLERRRQELQLYLADEQTRSDLRQPADFGALEFSTHAVQVASTDCIVAVGRLSQATTRLDGTALRWLSAISLRPGDADDMTRWEVMDELPNTAPDGELNDDRTMLTSSLHDYGDSLQNTCGGTS